MTTMTNKDKICLWCDESKVSCPVFSPFNSIPKDEIWVRDYEKNEDHWSNICAGCLQKSYRRSNPYMKIIMKKYA